MLYIQHNLKNNYLSATGSGDKEMAFDILLSELARLITMKPKVIINELRAAGLTKKDSMGRGELIKALADGLYGSPEFAKAIGRQIMLNQWPVTAQADGGDKPDYANILKGASSLLGGLGELFGGKNKEEGDRKLAERGLTRKVEAMDAFNGKVKSAGKTFLRWAGIGLLIGGSAYLIYRAVS